MNFNAGVEGGEKRFEWDVRKSYMSMGSRRVNGKRLGGGRLQYPICMWILRFGTE
jgi:hypothetical protein